MRHMTIIDSDIIDSIGYDASKHDEHPQNGPVRGTLEVVFKSSPDVVYRYDDVSIFDFVALVGADSIGKTFHEKFRKTKYPFTKSAYQKPTLKK